MYDIEEFRDVVGYEDLYEVSNEGRIRNKNTGRILKPNKIHNGYLQVSLCKDGERKPALVHRLVAQAFLPNPNHYPQVNHKDEDKTNNSVDNLEYCTIQYNINYSIHKRSKPVNQYALDGRLLNTYKSIKEAAEKTGIDNTDICYCCRNKRGRISAGNFIWKYVS